MELNKERKTNNRKKKTRNKTKQNRPWGRGRGVVGYQYTRYFLMPDTNPL